jgi:hypothetical protein
MSCGGRASALREILDAHADASSGGDAAAEAVADSADRPAPDADGRPAADAQETIPAPAGPPLAMPGISVWLDGDVGVVEADQRVATWADRSGLGHVFVGQRASEAGPHSTRLGNHGAVRFDGKSRVVSERFPAPDQEASLTFLQGGFLLAVVFQADHLSEAMNPAVMVTAMQPWIPAIGMEPGNGDVLLPHSQSFEIDISMAGLVAFSRDGAHVPAPGDYGPERPHLAVVELESTTLTVRIDGRPTAVMPNALSASDSLAYAPLYVGQWDFDIRGFEGAIGEVVVTKASPGSAWVTALEHYLLAKYELPLADLGP